MEEYETRAISTAENHCTIWRGNVNDTFVVQKTSDRERFLKHINSIDPYIQFTVEKQDQMFPCYFFTPQCCQSQTEPGQHRLQYAHSHRPIPTKGQPPQHCCIIQCSQHPCHTKLIQKGIKHLREALKSGSTPIGY